MNILIVEDNEINLRVATKAAVSLGHAVETAENGLEAVNAAADRRYDAILMDVQMPIMDGLEATRLIVKETNPEDRPHIIAITANAVIGDREACLAAGMDDYLTKPLRIEPLRIALAKVCSRGVSLIDGEQFDAVVDPSDPECLEIFEDFCELGKQQVAEVVTAGNQDRDWQRLGLIAHQLRGSSATFGFLGFSERISNLEASAKSATLTVIDEDELKSLFDRSVSEAKLRLPS